ncbi:hypothetical protein GQ600_12588 [Phytophthora cactorum]|nr:hypothetical protein GQ600_12588 [Phytophthora cactorum]
MAKGSTTVPATPSKSGGARNESSSPDVTAARLAAVSELSVSFEDEENMTPAPDQRCDSGDGTLSSGLSGRRNPDYDDFNDGTEGSKPSVASAKRSALLNAPRPPINGDTPAAKRVFDRVEALMRNDEWMQLFKPIPKRKADWPALANELQYPVNSVSTSQVAEDSTYPSTMSSKTGPHEAGAALQKWKKKLRKAFGAIGINEGKQPVSRLATLEEDPSKVPLPDTQEARALAHGDATFNKSYATYGREDEGSRGRRGGARASRNDPQAELTRQMREIAALNDSDPTPRIEMASHRPLDRIKPFSGSRNKSETPCSGYEPIHWFRQLPKKTKRTWKLLSNAFIRYYCSQFTQTALSATTRRNFEKGGRDAKEHVQQFLVTCGDDNMAESLYHTRVNDIHELEEIIEDVLKGKERMAKPVIPGAMSPMTVKADVTDVSQTSPVTLADASLDDLLAELEGREATRSGTERSDGEHHAHEDDQDDDGSLVDNDRHLAAANEGERRAAAEGTYARSDNRPPRGNIPIASEASIKTVAVGATFNQDRRVANAASIKTVEVVTEASVKTSMDLCSLRWMSHSAHYCNKRCMFCKQAHDAGQCELFRNFQDLAKFVRIKGTKEELPPELKSVVQERHLN